MWELRRRLAPLVGVRPLKLEPAALARFTTDLPDATREEWAVIAAAQRNYAVQGVCRQHATDRDPVACSNLGVGPPVGPLARKWGAQARP